jgi:hypothetical protein
MRLLALLLLAVIPIRSAEPEVVPVKVQGWPEAGVRGSVMSAPRATSW